MESITVDQNKQIVKDYFAGMLTDAPATVAHYFADDATWWMAGTLPVSGDHTKEEFIEIAKLIVDQFHGTLGLTISGMTAEGDRVAVEVSARGLIGGIHRYEQEFHMLFVVDGGKIVLLKEYGDTHLIHTMFFAT